MKHKLLLTILYYLKGLKAGQHEVPVLVTGSDLRAKYSSKTTKVTLRITEKN